MFFDGLIKSIDDIVVNLALSQVCLDGRKFCCYSVEALSELIYVGRRENGSGFKGFESQLCLQSLKFFSPHTRKGHFGLGHEGVRRRQLTVGCRRRKKRRGRGIFEGSPSLSFRSLAQSALNHGEAGNVCSTKEGHEVAQIGGASDKEDYPMDHRSGSL